MELEFILAHYGLSNLVISDNILHCGVRSLCNLLLSQLSMEVSQNLQTYVGHIEDVHVGFDGDRYNFDRITAFET